MTENKGIFGFLKNWGGVDSEEEQQRSYAIAKEKDSGNVIQSKESVVTEEIEFFVVDKLEKLLELSRFTGKVKVKQKYNYTLEIDIFDTGDDLGRIIGKNGYTLQAIQTLLKFFIIRQFNVSLKIKLDAGDYRSRQQNHIKQKALKAADRAVRSGERVVLDPMNASDRRFVHTLFEKNKKVNTSSEGSGSERRVVLTPSTKSLGSNVDVDIEEKQPEYITNE